MKDSLYEGLAYFEDFSGITATHKIGDTTLGVHYAKIDEGADIYPPRAYGLSGKSDWDDTDLYTFQAMHKFNDQFDMAGSVTFVDDNDADGSDSATQDLFFIGPKANFSFDNYLSGCCNVNVYSFTFY